MFSLSIYLCQGNVDIFSLATAATLLFEGATTLSITTFSITTLSITTLSITIKKHKVLLCWVSKNKPIKLSFVMLSRGALFKWSQVKLFAATWAGGTAL